MLLSGAAWSFVGASLRESKDIYRALGVPALDLLAIPGGLIDSTEIVANPARAAAPIKELGVPVANLIYNFAADFKERALNHPDDEVRRRNLADFHSVVEYCLEAGIASVTVLPGVPQDGWSRQKYLDVAAEALNELASIGGRRGVPVFFEAHVWSILESPAETLAFLQANPALKLTLDYAHFIWQGHSQAEIDLLAPYAGHVHLRQAAPRVLQARWADGMIDFASVVRVVRSSGYHGYFALEYEHDPWFDNDRVDVVCETIRMRDVVRPALA